MNKSKRAGGMQVDVTEQISSEVFRKTGSSPEEYRLVREKKGVFVYRCLFQGELAIAKYFVHEADRREIDNYRLFSEANVETVRVYALCERCVLMEDVEASAQWRMGVEEDLSDDRVARAIARWYVGLHAPDGGMRMRWSENDQLNRKNMELLQNRLPEAQTLWEYVCENLDLVEEIIQSMPSVITYNDFHWSNLAVRKDKGAALMLDYNLTGRGYRYADLRNVTEALSEKSGKDFMEEYERTYRRLYRRELDVGWEKQADDVISPILGLINACERAEFPKWTNALKSAATDGTLLEKARALFQKWYREKLKKELSEYTSYNEQEERDRLLILEWLESGESAFIRENRSAHITASAWIVNPARSRVLMAYHNIFGAWAWLGGHADGEANLKEVARREAMEESGIGEARLLSDAIFSVEALTVDGHEKNGKYVSSHLHLNVTYLFEANDGEALRVKDGENSAVDWVDADKLEDVVGERWMMERIYSKLRAKAESFAPTK